jgi:hypothetical protein
LAGATSFRVKPAESAFIESFNGWLDDELLNEIFFRSLPDACVALDKWRRDYNADRARIRASVPKRHWLSR